MHLECASAVANTCITQTRENSNTCAMLAKAKLLQVEVQDPKNVNLDRTRTLYIQFAINNCIVAKCLLCYIMEVPVPPTYLRFYQERDQKL